MKVKVIDFDDNFAVCNYIDLDGHNSYGYLHSEEINDLMLPITEKVKIGDELEAKELGERKGDMYLTVKHMNNQTFEDRVQDLNRFDSIKVKIVKTTHRGAIADIHGIPGLVSGNFEIGDTILATISKIINEKHLILLNLDSVIY